MRAPRCCPRPLPPAALRAGVSAAAESRAPSRTPRHTGSCRERRCRLGRDTAWACSRPRARLRRGRERGQLARRLRACCGRRECLASPHTPELGGGWCSGLSQRAHGSASSNAAARSSRCARFSRMACAVVVATCISCFSSAISSLYFSNELRGGRQAGGAVGRAARQAGTATCTPLAVGRPERTRIGPQRSPADRVLERVNLHKVGEERQHVLDAQRPPTLLQQRRHLPHARALRRRAALVAALGTCGLLDYVPRDGQPQLAREGVVALGPPCDGHRQLAVKGER